MAILIRTENDLPTLRCGVRSRSGGETLATRAFLGARALGDEVLTPIDAREVWSTWPDAITAQINTLGQESDPTRPIWLQVERDSPAAAVLPWERAIFAQTGRVALRIPNFLLNPVKPKALRRIAICITEPYEGLNRNALDGLWRLLRAVCRSTQRIDALAITIFTDASARNIAQHFAENERKMNPDAPSIEIAKAPGSDLQPGDPSQAGLKSLESIQFGRITNPWLRWIMRTYHKGGVDAVHFICPSHQVRDRGALMLRATGDLKGDAGSDMVGTDELSAFYDCLGCSIMGFTPFGRPQWRVGMRTLAYNLSWARPGAILVDENDEDPQSFSGLADAYAALISGVGLSGVGRIFPTSYLHPDILHTHLDERSVAPSPIAEDSSGELSFANADTFPISLTGASNSNLMLRTIRGANPFEFAASPDTDLLPRDILESETARLSLVKTRTNLEQAAEAGTWEALEFLKGVLEE